MAKYFADERPVLFPQAVFKPEDLTPEALVSLFKRQPGNSICLTFDGFERNCLGFLVHVRKSEGRYQLLNITGEIELFVSTEEQLIEVIKHVSGVTYSERAHKAFQQIRNDIGSGIPLDAFNAEY